MALYLEVPYEQKDHAKLLGAKWDQSRKQWYATNKFEYYKFLDWIPWSDSNFSLICDSLYIVEAPHKCFKCKKETNVISLAYNEQFMFYKDVDGNLINYEYTNNCLHYFTVEDEIDNVQLRSFLKDKFNYYYSYSKTIKEHYVANHCKHCGKIQGNFHLHEEIHSPFGEYPECTKDYKLYKIPLAEDSVGFPDYTYSCFSPDEDMDIITIYSIVIKTIEI